MFLLKKEILLMFFQSIFLVFLVSLSVVPMSCKVSEEGVEELIGGDYAEPCIENVTVIDSKSVELRFSDSVKVCSIVVSESIKDVSDSDEHSDTFLLSPSIAAAVGENRNINADTKLSDDGKILTVVFENEMQIGMKYEIFGTVEDVGGNSLTFCVPVTGYNPSVPKMIITEAQIKCDQGTLNGKKIYRAEYVELLALEDGNLSGLELLSASHGDNIFDFPAINVKKGEIILVHPRTPSAQGDGCINEDGDDLTLATAPHSNPEIRDLWSEQTSACYSDNDVIYLRNKSDNFIMDALLYAKDVSKGWDEKKVLPVVNALVENGICDSVDISKAMIPKVNPTQLKSITRKSKSIRNLETQFSENGKFPFKFNAAEWNVEPTTPGVIIE